MVLSAPAQVSEALTSLLLSVPYPIDCYMLWCGHLMFGETSYCKDNASASAMELAPIAEPQLIWSKFTKNGNTKQVHNGSY